jgi:endonuclease III
VEINRLLVPFGKHICTGQRPHCSRAPCSICASRSASKASLSSTRSNHPGE